MLLVLGVNNVGRNHPVVARVADALARTGVAVLVPDSRVLLEGRLDAGEVDGVVRAFQLLAARPEVDPERVGIVGFSVGGSLALLAAADPRIADGIRWVNAFGASPTRRPTSPPSRPTPIEEMPARRCRGRRPRWRGRSTCASCSTRCPPRPTAGRWTRPSAPPFLAAERPAPDSDLRASLESEVGRTIHDLLTARSLADAERAIDDLPAPSRAFLDAISPARQTGGLRAAMHLMHETEDHHVPFVESRALASVLGEAGLLRSHTEFRLFDHVQPDDVDFVAAAPELVKLLLHVRTLLEETL